VGEDGEGKIYTFAMEGGIQKNSNPDLWYNPKNSNFFTPPDGVQPWLDRVGKNIACNGRGDVFSTNVENTIRKT